MICSTLNLDYLNSPWKHRLLEEPENLTIQPEIMFILKIRLFTDTNKGALNC